MDLLVELVLEVEDTDFYRYKVEGRDDEAAARQVAQDALGHTGAQVTTAFVQD